LREEHRLRVLENRVLRKIFGPKGDEVTWEWRRLYNEEFMVRTSRGNQIKNNEVAVHLARIGDRRGTQRIWGGGGRPEGKRPLERPRLRWEDNIKRHLQPVGCGDGVD
jgi:hypothetical protein